MAENRRLAAIWPRRRRLLAPEGEDEAGTARAVREHREAAGPIVAGFGGRIVKTTGDGLLLEFPSVVAAVECAIAIQKLMVERNGRRRGEAHRLSDWRQLGDVLIEGDDILGDGVNIAARLEALCEPGGVMISGAAYEHIRGRIDAAFVDLGEQALKNIARPVRVYELASGASNGAPAQTKPTPAPAPEKSARSACRSSSCHSPTSAATWPRAFRRWGHGKLDHRSFAHSRFIRDRAQHSLHL